MGSENILSQIEFALDELPVSEKKVARYVLKNSKAVINMPINELAEQSKTSTAAVIRFCRSLGITSFPNLKIRIAAIVEDDTTMGYSDIKPNDDIKTIIQKTVANATQSFYDTVVQLDEDQVREAIHILQNAETIFFYGVGNSQIVAEDASQKWGKVGKRTYSISDQHMLATLMSNNNNNAVLWGISYSGDKAEVKKMLELAKVLGIKTISLTKKGSNKIQHVSDVNLQTARTSEEMLTNSSTTYRFAQMLVIDVVFLGYVAGEFDKIEPMLKMSNSVIQNL